MYQYHSNILAVQQQKDYWTKQEYGSNDSSPRDWLWGDKEIPNASFPVYKDTQISKVILGIK